MVMYHDDASILQEALKLAVIKADITKCATFHTLRPLFEVQLLEDR